jgi:hypothetical protein
VGQMGATRVLLNDLSLRNCCGFPRLTSVESRAMPWLATHFSINQSDRLPESFPTVTFPLPPFSFSYGRLGPYKFSFPQKHAAPSYGFLIA